MDVVWFLLIEHHLLWLLLAWLVLWLGPKVSHWWTTSRHARPKTAAELRAQLQEVEQQIQLLNQSETRLKPMPRDQTEG